MHIVPFSDDHLGPAAALLALRGKAAYEREPSLPALLADPSAARSAIERALAAPRAEGFAALHEGRLAGYLIGAIELPNPVSFRALLDPPRAGWITSHAAQPALAGECYRALYAKLAERWVAAGSFAHHIGLHAGDRDALDAWFALGFGQLAVHGLRDTRPVAGAALPAGITLRAATLDNLDAVLRFSDAVNRHQAASPMFAPYLPETLPDLRRELTALLSDPAGGALLAERDGQLLGGFSFGPPPEDMVAPERCVYIFDAWTAPEERGSGLGSALFDATLARAREHGAAWCQLNFLSANLPGARFWLGSGFRPLTLFLQRRLDERIAWATEKGRGIG
ncbi:MAG TPA: GNAT family N-acetyltransferase [Dehalococcoidia bacterium]|nr:GNAT family N-acetyltransferase [Dehalococcoidia bacterium]